MDKHTKGPWVAHKYPTTFGWHGWSIQQAEAPYTRIAAATVDDKAQGSSLIGAEAAEYDANAHLIAAAPDLLAACERQADTLERVARLAREALDDLNNERNVANLLALICNMAEDYHGAGDAIAKAKPVTD